MTNVFDKETPTTPTDTPEGKVEPKVDNSLNDLLSQIKDDNGNQKYADAEVAIKALNDSQSYIKKLEQEAVQSKATNDANEVELNRQKTVDDVLARIEASKEPGQETPAPSGLSADDVTKLVNQGLATSDAVKIATTNVNNVSKALVTKYGDKAQEAMLAAASANGYSADEFKALAETKPQAVLNLLGVTGTTSNTQSTPHSYNLPHEVAKKEAPTPERNMLVGATDKQRGAYVKDIREYIHDKYDVTV